MTTLLALWTGLYFVGADLDLATLAGTGVVLHVCHAIMCRLFAVNNGYPKNLWTGFGLLGGIWAVGLLILLPRRSNAD